MKAQKKTYAKLQDKLPTKKFVKAANMWCVMEVKDGIQKITWHNQEPILNETTRPQPNQEADRVLSSPDSA
jgi:hypothetical protein